MSEFPDIQPFGPRQPLKPEPAPTSTNATDPPAFVVSQRGVRLSTIATAVAVGFAAGYLAARYQQLIVSQSKLDQLLSYAQEWLREQGPKIADPIKQGLESTGATVEQAMKRVSASKPLESLHLFQRPKHPKFLGVF
ncbi:MAG: hypothetical protein JO279_08985 [Verrucomicrobia bacterium]|nr:hypothetical protein [Verrucomicrobiota bacterium]